MVDKQKPGTGPEPVREPIRTHQQFPTGTWPEPVRNRSGTDRGNRTGSPTTTPIGVGGNRAGGNRNQRYMVTLEAIDNEHWSGVPPARRLAHLLKAAKRAHGLRVVWAVPDSSVTRETPDPEPIVDPTNGKATPTGKEQGK